jgi:hypothetical protein
MITLISNPLSRWHRPTMMEWTLDGERSVNESGLTLAWIKRNNHNSGRFWSGTKMFLRGTRVNWVAAPLVNILWTCRGFHLAECPLVDCATGKRQKWRGILMSWWIWARWSPVTLSMHVRWRY